MFKLTYSLSRPFQTLKQILKNPDKKCRNQTAMKEKAENQKTNSDIRFLTFKKP